MSVKTALPKVDESQHIRPGHHSLHQRSARAPIRALRDHPLSGYMDHMYGHSIFHFDSSQTEHQIVQEGGF